MVLLPVRKDNDIHPGSFGWELEVDSMLRDPDMHLSQEPYGIYLAVLGESFRFRVLGCSWDLVRKSITLEILELSIAPIGSSLWTY